MKNIKLEKFEPTNQQSVSLVKGYLYDYPLPDSISTDWYKFEIIQHTYYTNKITQTSFDYDLSTLPSHTSLKLSFLSSYLSLS